MDRKFNFRMPAEMYEALNELHWRKRMSMAALARTAIEQYLAANRKEQ